MSPLRDLSNQHAEKKVPALPAARRGSMNKKQNTDPLNVEQPMHRAKQNLPHTTHELAQGGKGPGFGFCH